MTQRIDDPVLIAKYHSTCAVCGKGIVPGAKIIAPQGSPARHAGCTPEAVPDDAIRVYSRTADGWEKGAVIGYRSNKPNAPRYLYILRVLREREWDDDDERYTTVYEASCRPATEAEAAPLIAQSEREERERLARHALDAIKTRIMKEGERPPKIEGAQDDRHELQGTRAFDKQNIYGGGDWFVLGPEWIWYVRNNGMDGDDWGQNNVRTGGAGAIGWRVPATPELRATLEELRAVLEPARP